MSSPVYPGGAGEGSTLPTGVRTERIGGDDTTPAAPMRESGVGKEETVNADGSNASDGALGDGDGADAGATPIDTGRGAADDMCVLKTLSSGAVKLAPLGPTSPVQKLAPLTATPAKPLATTLVHSSAEGADETAGTGGSDEAGDGAGGGDGDEVAHGSGVVERERERQQTRSTFSGIKGTHILTPTPSPPRPIYLPRSLTGFPPDTSPAPNPHLPPSLPLTESLESGALWITSST